MALGRGPREGRGKGSLRAVEAHAVTPLQHLSGPVWVPGDGLFPFQKRELGASLLHLESPAGSQSHKV